MDGTVSPALQSVSGCESVSSEHSNPFSLHASDLTRSCGDNSDGQLGLGLTISSLNDAQGIVDKEFVSIQAVGAGGTALTKGEGVNGEYSSCR